MPTGKQPLWMLQIYYGGDWRNLFGSDKRWELVEYANQCDADLRIRIINTNDEEVKKHGR